MSKVRGIERFADAMSGCKGGYVLIGGGPAAFYLTMRAIRLELLKTWMSS